MKNLSWGVFAAPMLDHAQTRPSRPIRSVVPYTDGGITDVVIGVVTQKMQALLGPPIVVDNALDAKTLLGSEIVPKAALGGCTIPTVIGGYAAIVSALKTRQ